MKVHELRERLKGMPAYADVRIGDHEESINLLELLPDRNSGNGQVTLRCFVEVEEQEEEALPVPYEGVGAVYLFLNPMKES